MDGNKKIIAIFKEVDNPSIPAIYDLNISIVGEGFVQPCSGQFSSGEVVNISVIPHTGWHFRHWEGPNANDIYITADATYSIVMDNNKSLVAVFAAAANTLSISITGEGNVEKSPDKDYYECDEIVTLMANPVQGWHFSHWQGDAYTIDNPVQITMDNNKTINGVFVKTDEDLLALTVDIQGEGKVTMKPDLDLYEYGERITLTADAEPGWQFKEWSGDISSGSSQTHVVMDNNKTILATFEKIINYYTLRVNAIGKGIVTINPDNTVYREGSIVTLKAKTTDGKWYFVEWIGDAQGDSETIEIVMDSDKVIEALFEQPTFRLTASVMDGRGYIQIVSDDPDNDPEDYSEHYVDYAVGAMVTLTAKPATCWDLTHWVVDGEFVDGNSGANKSVQVIMDKDRVAFVYYEYVG